MLGSTLFDYLDRQGVKYTTIRHSRAFTTPEIAALTHISGKEFAKTVIVKMNGEMAMAVVSAGDHVDLEALKTFTGALEVSLASEGEFRGRFPDCETGAMPPFGNLYGMQVFVSEKLGHHQDIVFNAGSHSLLVRMKYHDFMNLVQPVTAPLVYDARAFVA